MIIIGLTGSIGMGKTTVGSMMQECGVAVHDSDVAVHDSLKVGGEGYKHVAAAFPYFEYPQIYGSKNKNGVRDIDRKALGKVVFNDPEKRKTLEAILHPLVQQAQQRFIKAQQRLGAEMAVLDIPLLFETGAENRVDYNIVVSAPHHVQRERVLSRAGMSEEKFEAILKAQMSDAEKCARADFVIKTGLSRGETMKSVKATLKEIKEKR